MITHVKLWNKDGQEIATFKGKECISKNPVGSLVADINRNNGTAMCYGETIVVSVEQSDIERTFQKLKNIFKSFDVTMNNL